MMIDAAPAETTATTPEPLRPVAETERVVAIDVLRGLAILGILLFNIGDFSFPSGHATILLERFPGLVDRIAIWGTRWFVEGKFYSMFSFLFGVGVAIQFERARARGDRFGPWFRRRLLVLLAIGLVHDILIWQGMILIAYAVVGMAMLLFVRRSSATIARWTVALVVVPLTIMALVFAQFAPGGRAAGDGASHSVRSAQRQAACDEEVALFADGSYLAQVEHRIVGLGETAGVILALGWYLLVMFLLGLLAWRSGILSNPGEALGRVRRISGWGLAIGATLSGIQLAARAVLEHPPPPMAAFAVMVADQIGSATLCLGYVATVLLALRSPAIRRLLAPLAPVGRTALSNYLLQSVVGTTIFYSWGLGLYGRVGPATNVLLVVAVFSCQLVISAWWLRRFRFGPAEWLWRSMTYGRRLPMRRLPAATTVSPPPAPGPGSEP